MLLFLKKILAGAGNALASQASKRYQKNQASISLNHSTGEQLVISLRSEWGIRSSNRMIRPSTTDTGMGQN
jgi:hypothetical protein